MRTDAMSGGGDVMGGDLMRREMKMMSGSLDRSKIVLQQPAFAF
jgi:hypothetical protein